MHSLAQVGGVFLIFALTPLLGALPLTRWLVQALTGKRLEQIGTGNVGVSAAFYHGGPKVGVPAVLIEAGKGIAVVLLARTFFPPSAVGGSEWELIALIGLVTGRFWAGQGAGMTNVVWGVVAHDWVAAALVFVLSGISFTIFRQQKQGRTVSLVLMALVVWLRQPLDEAHGLAAVCLAGLLYWISQKMPDDLDLPQQQAQRGSSKMFKLFRGDRALIPLTKPLDSNKVGGKAATLATLKSQGYPVPLGWVLPPGDDPVALVEEVDPEPSRPWVVRSSAVGEDSAQASAAGQYLSLLNLTDRQQVMEAIARCFASYNRVTARQYRQDRGMAEEAMAVVVQRQIRGVYSGVAFSRDPVGQEPGVVVVEAIAGPASNVVSGEHTPEQYRAWLSEIEDWHLDEPEGWQLPKGVTVSLQREADQPGQVPTTVIEQVAYLVRHLEARAHGIPQDIEWTYDGEKLWLLQARPVTTMLPLWTRKIAAEVIPGAIRPLTWSVNQPLTCGVWGEIFTLVLGDRASDLDFSQTAELHYYHAYFNATLLGEIFLRMGLPPESLEFLTRGAKFSKPPIASTLRSLPGLWRLARRELSLEKDFAKEQRRVFQPLLSELAAQPLDGLEPGQIWSRVQQVLAALEQATYFSIMAPLSAAVRQGLWKPDEAELDYSALPEIASLAALRELAADGDAPELDGFLREYGYLSEVGTDISVPTWREEPTTVEALLEQLSTAQNLATKPNSDKKDDATPPFPKGGMGGSGSGGGKMNPPRSPFVKGGGRGKSAKARRVQGRVTLKGEVTEVYSRLLAELRWGLVALAGRWQAEGLLEEIDEVFFLQLEELKAQVERGEHEGWAEWVAGRRSQFTTHEALTVQPLVYGNSPPLPQADLTPMDTTSSLRGIGASAGEVEGTVRVLRRFQDASTLPPQTILVVPYTDSGWAPLLSQAVGIVAEAGGRLSHGAIVAREYGIPAVMDINQAGQRLKTGQRVRLNGSRGLVTLVD